MEYGWLIPFDFLTILQGSKLTWKDEIEFKNWILNEAFPNIKCKSCQLEDEKKSEERKIVAGRSCREGYL